MAGEAYGEPESTPEAPSVSYAPEQESAPEEEEQGPVEEGTAIAGTAAGAETPGPVGDPAKPEESGGLEEPKESAAPTEEPAVEVAAETPQAEPTEDAEENHDYWVIWDPDTKTLTFQTEHYSGDYNGNEWYGDNSHYFSKDYTGGWHDYKHEVVNIVFANTGEIVLNGAVFYEFSSLTSVSFTGAGVVSLSTNAEDMFHKCTSLTTLDLTKMDTSKVTNMFGMFTGCHSLTSLNLSGWNTSGVHQMGDMFKGCSSLTTLNLSGWDTTHVTHGMDSMFSGCDNLTTLTVGENFKYTSENSPAAIPGDSTGFWAKTDDRTQPMLGNHEFLSYFKEGNRGGTYIFGHKLIYFPNGGSGTVPPAEVHNFGENVTLNDGSGLTKEKETFIGWTEKKPVDTVTTKDEERNANLKKGSFKTHSGENHLYAAWAVDENSNNIPDYDEAKVTVTFDINGGNGTGDSQHPNTYTLTDQLPGTPLRMYTYATLKWTKIWNKDGVPAQHPAILAGWTTQPVSDIILENDRDDSGKHLSDTLVNRTGAMVPNVDTTYYAVYAADEDGLGSADYLENSLQVEYYANGGKSTDGLGWIDGIDELFYRCSHHHVPNEDGVVLLSLDHGKEYVQRESAVLLGWSESPVTKLVASEDEKNSANIVTTVKMPDAGNKKVYAVWAEDINNNSAPDYTETKVKLTFDINHGDGSGDAQHKTTYTVELLPGTYFDLPDYTHLHWSEQWEKDGQPADFSAVLAGWADHPVDGIILEDDVNDAAQSHAHLSDNIIKQPHIKVPTSDVTYYAVYGADENHDNIADYLEFSEQVEYYANGGAMINGGWLDGVEGLFYRCGHHHVADEEVTLITLERGKGMIKRDGAVLLGWSDKQTELIVTADGETSAGITTTYIMPSGGDGRVYAVWAVDSNGNGIPDYEESLSEFVQPSPQPAESGGVKDDVPKTGDESASVVPFIVAAVAAGAAILTAYLLKKNIFGR